MQLPETNNGMMAYTATIQPSQSWHLYLFSTNISLQYICSYTPIVVLNRARLYSRARNPIDDAVYDLQNRRFAGRSAGSDRRNKN